jgi:acyl dehydratase
VIPYDELMAMPPFTTAGRYTDRETILYALGVGFMRDPANVAELPFVYEKQLRTVPSMAAIINPGSVAVLSQAKLDFPRIVHGEQQITLHQPLPPTAEFTASNQVIGAWDKGKDKGAILLVESCYRTQSGETIATVRSAVFARGDGGCGGPRSGAPEPHAMPARKADVTVTVDTRPDQAFLYALCGDRNPLHRDPAAALAAGFPRPIMHGLCTYGSACRAILQHVCDYDHTKIAAFDARFSAPMFPGETLLVSLWRDDPLVSFECRVEERDVVVIRNGRCLLRDPAQVPPRSTQSE